MDQAGLPAGVRLVEVAPQRLSGWLARFAERHGEVATQGNADRVQLSAADGSQAWIDVPFPPLTPAGGDLLSSLCNHVQQVRTIGVVLVRRGGCAAGVFEGTELLDSKVATSYVQGATKAGGWSQQRFARRRANQSTAAFAQAADVAVRVVLPRAGDLDAIVGGGDRVAVDTVFADVRLRPLASLPHLPLLSVPDPRLRVLQQTPAQFLAVRVHLYP